MCRREWEKEGSMRRSERRLVGGGGHLEVAARRPALGLSVPLTAAQIRNQGDGATDGSRGGINEGRMRSQTGRGPGETTDEDRYEQAQKQGTTRPSSPVDFQREKNKNMNSSVAVSQ